MYNVTPARIYKNDSDAWAESTSFGIDDLLVLSKVAEDCFSFIQEQIQKEAAARHRHREATRRSNSNRIISHQEAKRMQWKLYACFLVYCLTVAAASVDG